MKRNSVTRRRLLSEAGLLFSDGGMSPQYDVALAELIYWTTGGESVAAVMAEIRQKAGAK